MALILSGLSGQRFSFRGYIAKEPAARKQELVWMEERSKEERSTQIFIESPYRNRHTFEACLKTLQKETVLTVAVDLTLPSQKVVTQKIEKWRQLEGFTIEKKPTIFLLAVGN